ncbi:MAG: excinuclease ABC subunit UvrB [Anaerolineales bacterium]
MDFQIQTPFQPSGDQPEAIAQLVEGVRKGYKNQVLLGATGTGKTHTIARVIQELQMPALVMAHNKTLAAQLYAEFKDFFPHNAVEYFVSYYDYYQPEAYVPRKDLYIEKETDINEEIDRLRLAATASLMSRRDVIIVASVSCIYGLASPEAYYKGVIPLEVGVIYRRNALLRQLVESQYQRNDLELKPGNFRVRGDTLEIAPAYEDDTVYRISFWGDEVERMMKVNSMTGELLGEIAKLNLFPAKHFVADEDKLQQAIKDIETELEERLAYFKANEKFLEAQRIEQRTRYDLEMLKETGTCSGIENYSRPLDQRPPGSPPWTLIDYLPSDYLLILDESHMTVPQIRGMYNGDRSRKETLVEYGFRLPSALDNRPLKFPEFEQRMGYTIYTSATPGPYEMEKKDQVVEQIIRPTGLVDPQVEVRPTQGQIDDLVGELRERIARGERVLVTTLTKRMAEKLADYLMEVGIKVHYLHSEVHTLDRVGILRDLRMGVFDVLVGINLLREGLDLPEVSLVAILDADKEGFLRSDTALIQTIGRAARHVAGKVIMYADKMTDSMKRAIDETTRRRAKQMAHNEKYGIQPVSIVKGIHDLTQRLTTHAVAERQSEYRVGKAEALPLDEIEKLIAELEAKMKEAAMNLEFEQAAAIRDQIFELRGLIAEADQNSPQSTIRKLAGIR